MNNPASMFGHSLLRIDMGAPGERKDLLAYAINFAAETGRDGGVTFAWKGILGYYQGFFSIQPYYEMVKVYGDWESRDIWEYELNLSPEETERVLMHLWELRGVDFFYYFFDENCSYQLLSLLEVARPGLRLLDRIARPWVIPVDTVRAVVAEEGLVATVHFRPSAATALRHEERHLSPSLQRLARLTADGRQDPASTELQSLSDTERAAVLTVAYDYLRHAYLAKRVPADESGRRARRLLIARSAVPVTGPQAPPIGTPSVRPDQGHRTARAAVGAGLSDGRFYLDIRLRPAFHDLMDPVGGYTRGAQINFLEIAGRLYPDEGDARLQELTVVDIVSLSPRDRFFKPISWKIRTGLISRVMPSAGRSRPAERHVWHTSGGAGIAFELWYRSLAYGFLEATADAGSAFRHGVAAGPGSTAGVYLGPGNDRWKSHLFAHVTHFALGDQTTAAHLGAEARLTLTPNTALQAAVTANRTGTREWLEAGTSWNLYF